MKLIQKSGRRGFELVHEDQALLNVLYPKWHKSNCFFSLQDHQYEIEPANFWGTRYQVKKDGQIIAEVKGSMGKYRITTNQPVGEYLLTRKGFWKTRYELEDTSKKILITYEPHNGWSAFHCDIVYGDHQLDGLSILELTVYAGFSILKIKQANAAIAGAGA